MGKNVCFSENKDSWRILPGVFPQPQLRWDLLQASLNYRILRVSQTDECQERYNEIMQQSESEGRIKSAGLHFLASSSRS